MSTITYEVAPTHTAQPVAKTAPKRQGLFALFYARMIEARREAAMREFRRHAHLLPNELEQPGWKINERSEDSLPFVR